MRRTQVVSRKGQGWEATKRDLFSFCRVEVSPKALIFTTSSSCNLTDLENNTSTVNFAYSHLSQATDEQSFYPIHGATVRHLTANTCIAQKAWEVAAASGNEAEMVIAQIIVKRVN